MNTPNSSAQQVFVLAGYCGGKWSALDSTAASDGDHDEAIAFLESQQRAHALKFEKMKVVTEEQFSLLQSVSLRKRSLFISDIKSLSYHELKEAATPAPDNPGNSNRVLNARRELSVRLMALFNRGVIDALFGVVETYDKQPHSERLSMSAPVEEIRSGLQCLDGSIR